MCESAGAKDLDPCTTGRGPYQRLCLLHSSAEGAAKLKTSCPDLAVLTFGISGHFAVLSL